MLTTMFATIRTNQHSLLFLDFVHRLKLFFFKHNASEVGYGSLFSNETEPASEKPCTWKGF